jgi:hypothetical protein
MSKTLRVKEQVAYTLLARYREGHWLRRFNTAAASANEACSHFDASDQSNYWHRVSDASIANSFDLGHDF